MVTMSWTLTGRRSLLSVLSGNMRSWYRRSGAQRKRARLALTVILRLTLVLAGLGLTVAAAWDVTRPLGLLTAGISVLAFEWWVKR